MIVLVTDFGAGGPYVGQMKAVLHRDAPGIAVVELFNAVAAYDIRACAYLIAAYVDDFPENSVFLCVVDPGVGTPSRAPVVLHADGRWFVGPGNGLFDVIARRSEDPSWWEITWRPQRLSSSFHGRDLFAPVAAYIARAGLPREWVASRPRPERRPDWPEELFEIVYIDNFGNAMLGARARTVPSEAQLRVGEIRFPRAHTFGELPPGQAFWYENANGLIELAVNRGSAADQFSLKVGDEVHLGRK